MPLVVPGLMTSGGDQQGEWMNKLMGKKLSDSTSDATNFAKQDLPKEHRILESGAGKTMDHRADRLNVHLAEDGTVSQVSYG